jgi:protein MAK16
LTYNASVIQIDKELKYWPNFTIHKCKQRITKITQYLIKMRRIKLRQECVSNLCDLLLLIYTCFRPKLVGVKKKLDRREATRERKALSAAHLEKSIEKELIERLKSKAYGDAPLNVNESVWQTILDREKSGKEKELNAGAQLDMEADETDGEEEEEEMEEDWDAEGGEFVSDFSGDEDGDLDDLSDLEDIVDGGLDAEESGDDQSDYDSSPEDQPPSKTVLGKRKTKPTAKAPPRKKLDKPGRSS